MTMKTLFKHTVLTALISCFFGCAYAEEAPVYDVDSYPPQFDGQPDSGSAASSSAPARAVEMPHLTMDQRISRLEQQVNNLAASSAKLNALQADLQSLRGQLEDLSHQLQQMQTQQKAMYTDLDKRISSKAAVVQSAAQEPVDAVPAAKTKKTAPAKEKPAVSDTPDTSAVSTQQTKQLARCSA